MLSFSVKTIFIWSLFLLPVGLLFGEVPTSVAEIIVFTLWLLTNEWKNKLQLLVHNKYFWILSSLYFIHIVGLFYTSDFNYALNDLRIKIPVLLFPIIFFSVDFIKPQHIILFLKWFIIVTFINLLYLWINKQFNNDLLDTRDISLFISHIRLGLISAFAVITSIYLVINHIQSSFQKIFFITIASFIFILILFLGLITGIISLIIVTLFAIFYMYFKNKNKIHFQIITALTIIAGITLFLYIQHIHKKYFPPATKNIHLKSYTSNNNKYEHHTELPYTENGNYVFINICDIELKKEWEKKSNIPFESVDKKNNKIKYTLYRYLASKNLTKDSAGITQLSNEDIKNIECGYPNYLYAKANIFEKRMYELLQEYEYFKINRDPNGKTMIMRLFYWKIGLHIWMKNFWTGVGTGDVRQAFDNEYQQYPNIQKKFQLRTHHQIITIALTFGLFGLIIMLISIFYPLIKLSDTEYYFIYYLFAILAITSFFIDDTLETQAGVTFYTLFNTLLIKFCLLDKSDKKENT